MTEKIIFKAGPKMAKFIEIIVIFNQFQKHQTKSKNIFRNIFLHKIKNSFKKILAMVKTHQQYF